VGICFLAVAGLFAAWQHPLAADGAITTIDGFGGQEETPTPMSFLSFGL